MIFAFSFLLTRLYGTAAAMTQNVCQPARGNTFVRVSGGMGLYAQADSVLLLHAYELYAFVQTKTLTCSHHQVLALAMCAVTAEAFAPSFMGQGLNLRQAKASSALSMKIELAPLPYDYTALEPKIGKQTLEVRVFI